MCFLPYASLPVASASVLMCHLSLFCCPMEVLLSCLQSRRSSLPSGWSTCAWPWENTFQTCWAYTNKLLYPSRFLVLDLVPVPVVHISDRNSVGGWISSCLPPTQTLSFFFSSCGTEVILISRRTVLNRSGAERCKNEKCPLLWWRSPSCNK